MISHILHRVPYFFFSFFFFFFVVVVCTDHCLVSQDVKIVHRLLLLKAMLWNAIDAKRCMNVPEKHPLGSDNLINIDSTLIQRHDDSR